MDQEDYGVLVGMAQEHGAKVANGLIGLLTDSNETIKWRAVKALGKVTDRLFSEDPEKVRKVIRQLIWNLNDESGGIGWGMPEALGEILAEVPALQKEYLGLLTAYISEDRCFLENVHLQTGVVWGLGRIKIIDEKNKAKGLPFLLKALHHQNPLLRGMAVWTLGEIRASEAVPILKTLQKENGMIKIFIDNRIQEKPLRQWAEEALKKI